MAGRTVRRSQAVVPFGIGSIVEFEYEALMPAGLDVWEEIEADVLYDDRLARRLGIEHFRMPPGRSESDGFRYTSTPLPFVRFPQWHFCPRCRALKKADLYAKSRPRCANPESSDRLGKGKKKLDPCGSLAQKRRSAMRPVRFIAVCPNGHIEDFPWLAWAHAERGKGLSKPSECESAVLYFYPTRKSGLTGLMVKCGRCGKKRSLMGATGKHGLRGFTCSGDRPWLGKVHQEACQSLADGDEDAKMLALQRGASNLYFPEVSSSILIPPYSTKVRQVLTKRLVRHMLDSARENGEIPDSNFASVAEYYKVDVNELQQAYYDTATESDTDWANDEVAFRYAEFTALHSERRDEQDALTCRPLSMAEFQPIVRDHLYHVGLVERLTETRALTGFRRIDPGLGPLSVLSATKQPWLPAFRVCGEGIFLGLKPERLAEFAARDTGRSAAQLKRAGEYGRSLMPVTIELIFLHTLAHLLIKRLSYEAGYGASSIRERIFSAPPGHDKQMTGLLLYTAAGDADGTLGGLVTLAKPGALERVLVGAIEEARWCAADPVCMESRGQGPESLNLAACHACCLLPETSCEFQNRFLDRGIVNSFFE